MCCLQNTLLLRFVCLRTKPRHVVVYACNVANRTYPEYLKCNDPVVPAHWGGPLSDAACVVIRARSLPVLATHTIVTVSRPEWHAVSLTSHFGAYTQLKAAAFRPHYSSQLLHSILLSSLVHSNDSLHCVQLLCAS